MGEASKAYNWPGCRARHEKAQVQFIKKFINDETASAALAGEPAPG
jgi:hypothetical protein